jgi:hypothetical protein
MYKSIFHCSLFAVALMAWSPCQARADMIALNPTGSGVGRAGHNSTKGWAFTTSSPILVTQLGLWDQGNNGLNTSHMVSIWTSTGTLMAQSTITSGTGATLMDGTPMSLSRPSFCLRVVIQSAASMAF